MSNIQFILTIAVCAAATMLTRFLPFLVFGSRGGKVPEVVEYLGHVLPAAIFGMLIVYCLKGVSLTSGSHGIPEAIAIGVTVALHKWKHQTLVSIAGGTLCYAYAQHSFTLQGNINAAMGFVRAMEITEGYLFPSFWAKRILKRLPKKRIPTLGVYVFALLGL